MARHNTLTTRTCSINKSGLADGLLYLKRVSLDLSNNVRP